jgi:exopolysaccharide biosynthesis protein
MKKDKKHFCRQKPIKHKNRQSIVGSSNGYNAANNRYAGKKIKEVKDICPEDFSEEDIEKELIELVKDGMLGIILSNESDEWKKSYINASQLIVKCPHCNNIVNVGKKNPHPK